MLKLNYIRLLINYSIFVFENEIIVIIYVNDLLIVDSKKKNEIINFKKKITKRFRIIDLNFISYYLNVKIRKNRKRRIMYFNQINYIKQLVNEYEFINCKSMNISM